MTGNGALTAVVADDEQLARDELCFLLGQLEGVEVVGQAANGVEALDEIARHAPDVAFLDVQMPGLTGFEVARRVMESGTGPSVIFVTAFDQRAIEACPLFEYLTPLERLRGLRIALPWEVKAGEALPAVALGEPVAHIVLAGEGKVGETRQGPGALVYPQALVKGAPTPDKALLAQAVSPMRLLTIRRDDFLEITEEEAELGVKMYAVLAKLMAR